MQTFRKIGSPSMIHAEACGLRWLAQAESAGGARIVPVLNQGDGYLEEPYLPSVPPTAQAADDFGHALAHTHAAGASHLGAPPPGVQRCWMGSVPLSVVATPPAGTQSWGAYYAEHRVVPHAKRCRFTIEEQRAIDHLCERLAAGVFDHSQPALVQASGVDAARTHGDLWSGNLMWTPQGVTLIDPSAQGGHAEEDLAALAAFGCPHLDRIWSAYNEASPLADGWQERIALHQLHIFMIHVEIFGRSYASDVMSIVHKYS